jgi:Zn-dependent metalloprotease
VSLAISSAPRRERHVSATVAGMILVQRRGKRRAVYDAQHTRDLPGRTVRVEGARAVRDAAVNEAYEHAGRTYDYFRRVHGRSSLDDRGMRLESTVHFGSHFNNAHWNGRQMIYGDGDGKYFHRFTASLDVVAHELTHGVTHFAAGLGSTGQCGALAEHFSDVFAALVKQHALQQTAARADWLIGADLLTDRVNGEALRSMKAPGTAFDDRVFGRDPQPAHMRDYVRTRADDGGVHTNSGIPNHAFYRAASLLGGRAWEAAGRIWYRALTTELGPRSRFQHCADATLRAAAALYGARSEPHAAVREAWRAVGIEISAESAAPAPRAEAVSIPSAGAELPFLPI